MDRSRGSSSQGALPSPHQPISTSSDPVSGVRLRPQVRTTHGREAVARATATGLARARNAARPSQDSRRGRCRVVEGRVNDLGLIGTRTAIGTLISGPGRWKAASAWTCSTRAAVAKRTCRCSCTRRARWYRRPGRRSEPAALATSTSSPAASRACEGHDRGRATLFYGRCHGRRHPEPQD
jgi:hypothetical protein